MSLRTHWQAASRRQRIATTLLLVWLLYAFVREKWSPDIVAAIAVAANAIK